MNQNTKALLLESYQAMMDNLIQLDIAIASNEDLSCIVATAENKPTELAEHEWIRFQTVAYPRITSASDPSRNEGANISGPIYREP